MRALTLYLRSRAVPTTAAAVLGCAVALWALGLAVDNPQSRVLAALLLSLAATTAIGHGLAGADHDLDKTTAIAWPPRRAAHIIVAGAPCSGYSPPPHSPVNEWPTPVSSCAMSPG